LQELTALLEAGGLAAQIAQVVKLGTAYFRPAHDFDFLDARAFDQESTLDTDTVTGDTTDGEIGIVAAAAHANDQTLKHLDTFPITLDNADMNLDGIA
jgi:hypothetical protein